MSEGRQNVRAAPRPLSEIVRELRQAEQVGDEARVSRLRAELRAAADAGSHVEGGWR